MFAAGQVAGVLSGAVGGGAVLAPGVFPVDGSASVGGEEGGTGYRLSDKQRSIPFGSKRLHYADLRYAATARGTAVGGLLDAAFRLRDGVSVFAAEVLALAAPHVDKMPVFFLAAVSSAISSGMLMAAAVVVAPVLPPGPTEIERIEEALRTRDTTYPFPATLGEAIGKVVDLKWPEVESGAVALRFENQLHGDIPISPSLRATFFALIYDGVRRTIQELVQPYGYPREEKAYEIVVYLYPQVRGEIKIEIFDNAPPKNKNKSQTAPISSYSGMLFTRSYSPLVQLSSVPPVLGNSEVYRFEIHEFWSPR